MHGGTFVWPSTGGHVTDRFVGFAAIHDAYRPKILRYVTRLVGEAHAEDVTQHVLLKLSEGLGQFRGESSLSTWVYRIATNAAFDHLRRPCAQPMHHAACIATAADSDSEPECAGIEESIPSVETRVIRQEMSQCVRDFVEQLPDHYKSVIVLSEFEGFKNSEIGEILGISLGAVKIRLHRAREQLRQDLSSGCSFHRDERNEFACDRKP
jgi:RNA polymerase sigma-70 factor, ECF subfamily